MLTKTMKLSKLDKFENELKVKSKAQLIHIHIL